MPQTDVLVIGFKSISVVIVFLIFLLHFLYINSIYVTNIFKIIVEFSKNIILFAIVNNFKDAVILSRKHLSIDFTTKIC